LEVKMTDRKDEKPHEIPYIKPIMKLRLMMLADRAFAASVRAAIHKACDDKSLDIPREAVDAIILVHPEEVATTEAVGTLPVGSQCQAWVLE
jgi:hypothetical protein